MSSQNLILDTNIIQYITDDFVSKELIPYLLTLRDKGYTENISTVSVFESIKGLKRVDEPKLLGFIAAFPKYEVDERVLTAAARLHNLYNQDKSVPSDGISSEDKIIAATAIITNSFVLTANINDFPRPYFNEIEKEKLIYQNKKQKDVMLCVEVLQPDFEYLKSVLIEHGYLEEGN